MTAEQLYDRQWTLVLLQTVLERLEAEFTAAGKQARFERLKGFLIGGEETLPYADLAKELDSSEAAIKMAVSRMRQRYRELLRQEVRRTVEADGDVDDELASLFRTLVPD